MGVQFEAERWWGSKDVFVLVGNMYRALSSKERVSSASAVAVVVFVATITKWAGTISVFVIFHWLERRLDCLERPLVYVWKGLVKSREVGEDVVLCGRESNGGSISIFFFPLYNLGLSSHYGKFFHGSWLLSNMANVQVMISIMLPVIPGLVCPG